MLVAGGRGGPGLPGPGLPLRPRTVARGPVRVAGDLQGTPQGRAAGETRRAPENPHGGFQRDQPPPATRRSRHPHGSGTHLIARPRSRRGGTDPRPDAARELEDRGAGLGGRGHGRELGTDVGLSPAAALRGAPREGGLGGVGAGGVRGPRKGPEGPRGDGSRGEAGQRGPGAAGGDYPAGGSQQGLHQHRSRQHPAFRCPARDFLRHRGGVARRSRRGALFAHAGGTGGAGSGRAPHRPGLRPRPNLRGHGRLAGDGRARRGSLRVSLRGLLMPGEGRQPGLRPSLQPQLGRHPQGREDHR